MKKFNFKFQFDIASRILAVTSPKGSVVYIYNVLAVYSHFRDMMSYIKNSEGFEEPQKFRLDPTISLDEDLMVEWNSFAKFLNTPKRQENGDTYFEYPISKNMAVLFRDLSISPKYGNDWYKGGGE